MVRILYPCALTFAAQRGGEKMGILEDAFGTKEVKETAPGVPFKVKMSFRPVRLSARSDDSAELLVDIENVSSEPVLASFLVRVPKALGFDSVGAQKEKEFRLGYIEPGKKSSLAVPITGNNQTPPGMYKILAAVVAHYRDYSHIQNMVRKELELRVV